jgi:hypothetical protein
LTTAEVLDPDAPELLFPEFEVVAGVLLAGELLAVVLPLAFGVVAVVVLELFDATGVGVGDAVAPAAVEAAVVEVPAVEVPSPVLVLVSMAVVP